MSGMRTLLWNPIIAKEIHSRMRSLRTAVVVIVFLSILSLAAYLAYVPFGGSSSGLDQAARISQAGIAVFAASGITVLFLVALTVPGLVGAAISGERERQTLDLLLCTPVRPSRIVIGKLVSSVLFILVLIAASVPIFATAFLLGGVGAGQLAVLVTLCVATTMLLGSLAMLCSVVMRRGGTAIVAAYGLTAGILVLPNIAPIVFQSSPVMIRPRAIATLPAPTGGSVSSSSGSFSGASTPPSTVTVPGQNGPRVNLPWITYASPATSALVTLGTEALTRTSSSCTVGGNCDATFDTLPDGLFSGWHVWEVFLLLSIAISALTLTLSVVILRGYLLPSRRSSRPPPAAPQPA